MLVLLIDQRRCRPALRRVQSAARTQPDIRRAAFALQHIPNPELISPPASIASGNDDVAAVSGIVAARLISNQSTTSGLLPAVLFIPLSRVNALYFSQAIAVPYEGHSPQRVVIIASGAPRQRISVVIPAAIALREDISVDLELQTVFNVRCGHRRPARAESQPGYNIQQMLESSRKLLPGEAVYGNLYRWRGISALPLIDGIDWDPRWKLARSGRWRRIKSDLLKIPALTGLNIKLAAFTNRKQCQ